MLELFSFGSFILIAGKEFLAKYENRKKRICKEFEIRFVFDLINHLISRLFHFES